VIVGGTLSQQYARGTKMQLSIAKLQAMRTARMERCNTHKCMVKGYYCGQCRRLNKKMCMDYHACEGSLEEFEKRLCYEFTFGIIDESHIADGSWLEYGLRDFGHTKRLRILLHNNMCKVIKWQ
jgi:hypothetical protein